MLKVLVTGGAGYVGSTLVPMLLEKNYHVRVLDNLMYGGDALIPCFRHENFEMLIGDITKASDVKEALKGMDLIIHLAAIVGFPACKKDPELAKKVNVEGTKIINQARSKKQLIVFASTGSNYGDLESDICTEETPLKPLTEYGITKTEAEKYLLNEGYSIAYRFATGFGLSPRLRLDLLVNDFVFRALKERNLIIYEKHFKRSFINVTDMARAFIFAIENAVKMIDDAYNVGDEELCYNKEEVALEIKKKIDFYLHFAEIGEDPDKRNYFVSYKKIKQLGYQTTISLQKGIDNLKNGLSMISLKSKYSNV